MGNGQSIPPEITARIDDLERRIAKGDFGKTPKGKQEVKQLLDYWENKYGNPSGGEVTDHVKNYLERQNNINFDCDDIFDGSTCKNRTDSGCMWTPRSGESSDDRYLSPDKERFIEYGGLCSEVEKVPKHETEPRVPDIGLSIHKGDRKTRPRRVHRLLMDEIDPHRAGSVKYKKRLNDRKLAGMVKGAQNLTSDEEQAKTGTLSNIQESKTRGGKRKLRRKGRKTHKKKYGRKSRKRRKSKKRLKRSRKHR